MPLGIHRIVLWPLSYNLLAGGVFAIHGVFLLLALTSECASLLDDLQRFGTHYALLVSRLFGSEVAPLPSTASCSIRAMFVVTDLYMFGSIILFGLLQTMLAASNGSLSRANRLAHDQLVEKRRREKDSVKIVDLTAMLVWGGFACFLFYIHLSREYFHTHAPFSVEKLTYKFIFSAFTSAGAVASVYQLLYHGILDMHSSAEHAATNKSTSDRT